MCAVQCVVQFACPRVFKKGGGGADVKNFKLQNSAKICLCMLKNSSVMT